MSRMKSLGVGEAWLSMSRVSCAPSDAASVYAADCARNARPSTLVAPRGRRWLERSPRAARRVRPRQPAARSASRDALRSDAGDDAARPMRALRLARVLLLAAARRRACPLVRIATYRSAPQALPSGVVGARYSAQLNSDCGGDDWFIQTGDLPPGIGLQENGNIQGVPTTAGIYTVHRRRLRLRQRRGRLQGFRDRHRFGVVIADPQGASPLPSSRARRPPDHAHCEGEE